MAYNKSNNYKKTRKSDSVFTGELVFEEGTSVEIENEVKEVLAETKFDKISIPLNTYRRLLSEDGGDSEDTKITTIGYIKNYNPETEKFTVVIFNTFKDIIKSWEDLRVQERHTITKEGTLKTIIKFLLV